MNDAKTWWAEADTQWTQYCTVGGGLWQFLQGILYIRNASKYNYSNKRTHMLLGLSMSTGGVLNVCSATVKLLNIYGINWLEDLPPLLLDGNMLSCIPTGWLYILAGGMGTAWDGSTFMAFGGLAAMTSIFKKQTADLVGATATLIIHFCCLAQVLYRHGKIAAAFGYAYFGPVSTAFTCLPASVGKFLLGNDIKNAGDALRKKANMFAPFPNDRSSIDTSLARFQQLGIWFLVTIFIIGAPPAAYIATGDLWLSITLATLAPASFLTRSMVGCASASLFASSENDELKENLLPEKEIDDNNDNTAAIPVP